VKVTHTNLPKVTRVKLIHHDTMVVLTTGVTATTGVATMSSDTTETGRTLAALFASLVGAGRHDLLKLTEKQDNGRNRCE
jgi:hypothetical protein